jgi:hypothetical protein
MPRPSRHRPRTVDVVLDYVRAHPGCRPRDTWRALARQHPTLTYDMVVRSLCALLADEHVVKEMAPNGVTCYRVAPESASPWVHPIRERYLRLVGAL